MAKWDDGYVTDIGYVHRFQQEITPAWLVTASVLLGYRPPDVSRPFRYADIGCGYGLTALTVAACSPQAEVWGFDFNPAHIESARHLASKAGLTNVHFVETSFADLAAMNEAALPQFDFMVSHGVVSWVSPANRASVVRVINQRLKAGGIAYLSYNVATGWSGMEPLRRLMRMLADASPLRPDLAMPGILDYLDQLKASGAVFFAQHPGLEARLVDMRKQDVRYLAHEYLNSDWTPLAFADMARDMADAKCGYIGSATLSENLDAVAVPPNVMPLLNDAREPVLRETLRDFAAAQGFRRDLYRRGTQPLAAAEHTALAEELGIIQSGLKSDGQVMISTPLGQMTGRPEIYKPLVAILEHGPVLVRQMRSAPVFSERPLQELLQAVALLISGGYAHALLPGGDSAAARAACAGLNRAISAANVLGADIPFVVAPAIGLAVGVDLLETLLVSELVAGQPANLETLTTAVLQKLIGSGRTVQRSGQPVHDPVEARAIVNGVLAEMLERRVPLLSRYGVLPA